MNNQDTRNNNQTLINNQIPNMRIHSLITLIILLTLLNLSPALTHDYLAQNVVPLTAATDLASAYAYPNPANFNAGITCVTFTNLSANCTIRIFNPRGELAKTISITGGSGETTWNGVTDFGGNAAAGVYLYLIESGSEKKTGKLIILR
ncbi:MAG: T9SS type A sorting domain-containing protein [Candidatus Margulisiibacteriota bacterium]